MCQDVDKQSLQDRADEWAFYQMQRVMDLLDGSEEGLGYIDMMLAAYLRMFGSKMGSDPQDFLNRLTFMAYATDEGELAWKWTFIEDLDLLGDEDGGEDFGNDVPGAGQSGPTGLMGKRIA